MESSQNPSATPIEAHPTASGTTVKALSEGGQFLLWNLRHWTQATRHRQAIQPLLRSTHAAYGCEAAADTLDELFCLLALGATRKIVVQIPCERAVHADELQLINALRWTQNHRRDQAEAALNTLVIERLQRLFLRLATEYTTRLTEAGLPLTSRARLRLVRP